MARLAAAGALTFFDRADGVEVLRPATRSREDWMRFAAAMALIRLNTSEARDLLHDGYPGSRLVNRDREEPPALAIAGVLQENNESARHYAARALVFFNNPATLPALRAAFHDPSSDVRSAARLAVRHIERRQLLPARP